MNSRLHRDLEFKDYFRILLKNRWLLLFCALSFVGPTFWFTHRIPDTFIAASQLVMESEKNQGLMALEASGTSRNLGYYRALFQSSAFADRVAGALEEPLRRAKIAGSPAKFLADHTSLGEGSIESFLAISTQTPSAELSHAITRTATDSLIAFSRRVANEEAEKATAVIREQIEICVRKREEILQEKNALTDAAHLATLGDFEGLTALEKGYQEELVKYELDKAGLSAKRNYFRALDRGLHPVKNPKADSASARLKYRLHELEKERERSQRLGITLGPESRVTREIQELEGQIAALSGGNEPRDLTLFHQWQSARKETAVMESEMQLKKARLDAFKNAIVDYRENHPDVGKREFQLKQLDNLLERYTDTHQRLNEKLEDAVIRLQSESGGLKLVDASQVPEKPVARRDYIFHLIALAAALALGVGLSLLREFMDDTVKSPEDVEKDLALTLLGTIPHIQVKKTDMEVKRTITKGKNATIRNRYPELALGPGKEESVVAEAYRTLRTNIVFASPDRPVQTLLMSSSGPGEGKSLTMANTALSFAQQGEPTLIVDTDLRRPVVHHLFGLDRSPGFGEFFAGNATLSDIVREVPGTNLKVMTAGAYMPNPAEVLGSKKMDALLNEMKKEFRYVLFDTPPIIAVTDACILASKVDGVSLVVRAGKTAMSVAERALQQLRNVNARVLGCILNDVDLSKGYSSYGYYKHYYHYYLTRKD